MLSTSHNGQLNRYLEQALQPQLQAHGFQLQGRLFRRHTPLVIQVVEARLLRDDSRQDAQFTLEVGLCFPSLLAALARLDAFVHLARHVVKPTIQSCALRRRLGEFDTPARDSWWPLAEVPAAQNHALLTLLVDQALPWLESAGTLQALAQGQYLDDGLTARLMQALACLQLGQDNRALETCLNHADGRYPDNLGMARRWAAELYNQLAAALQPPPPFPV